MRELDMTSQFIGSSLSDYPSSPVRAKVESCKSLDHFVFRSGTAQPLGFYPEALSPTIANR